MSCDLLIRPVQDGDLPELFEHQLDPEANRMAAFTAEDPTDGPAFLRHWARVLGDPAIIARVVVVGDVVVGNVLAFPEQDRTEVSYWIGREYWGRGYARGALTALLAEVTRRPLHARAAKDNVRSLAVLASCGFVICGEDSGYAPARGVEVEEVVLTLPADPPRGT